MSPPLECVTQCSPNLTLPATPQLPLALPCQCKTNAIWCSVWFKYPHSSHTQTVHIYNTVWIILHTIIIRTLFSHNRCKFQIPILRMISSTACCENHLMCITKVWNHIYSQAECTPVTTLCCFCVVCGRTIRIAFGKVAKISAPPQKINK